MLAPPNTSYWLETAPEFTGAADVALLGDDVDVAVIGAGFTGLSTALELAKRGAKVAVFEAGRVVGGASGRNGGQCNNGLAHDFAGLAAQIGRDQALYFYNSYVDAVNTVEKIVEEYQIDCNFNRCGRLKLAVKPEHFKKFEKSYDILRDGIDQNVELITPDNIQHEVGSSQFYGGLLQKTSAQMHVGKFGVGLAEAAAKKDVKIFENAAVEGYKPHPKGGFELDVSGQKVKARQIFVATGGHGQSPFGWFRRRIVPVGSFAVVTHPLGKELLDDLFPTRRNYVTSKNIGNYFMITPDDRLLFGGRASFSASNAKTDGQAAGTLSNMLADIFPELTGIGLDHCWGGQVDMTQDRLPRAGEKDGIFYAMGYSGHGVQMSVHMGPIMADVMEGKTESNPWRDLDWPAIPGYFGKPWFLPFVGAYYRLQDYFD